MHCVLYCIVLRCIVCEPRNVRADERPEEEEAEKAVEKAAPTPEDELEALIKQMDRRDKRKVCLFVCLLLVVTVTVTVTVTVRCADDATRTRCQVRKQRELHKRALDRANRGIVRHGDEIEVVRDDELFDLQSMWQV